MPYRLLKLVVNLLHGEHAPTSEVKGKFRFLIELAFELIKHVRSLPAFYNAKRCF